MPHVHYCSIFQGDCNWFCMLYSGNNLEPWILYLAQKIVGGNIVGLSSVNQYTLCALFFCILFLNYLKAILRISHVMTYAWWIWFNQILLNTDDLPLQNIKRENMSYIVICIYKKQKIIFVKTFICLNFDIKHFVLLLV